MPLAAGTKLGPYEITALIGSGGMGEVYRGKDTRLDRTVAIKILPQHLSANPDLKQRFEREARAVSSLSHPHICALHDIGHQNGIDYVVMEYLDGETLASRIAKGPLPLDRLLRFGIEIASALEKAHRTGIIHRDLKPGNIMITREGSKLLDFGLAKFATQPVVMLSGVSVRPTEVRDLTAEGTILGTLQYMSPEQLEGKETDARTDIFALGAILYEMATGRKAFTGNSQASLIAAILSSEPPPISSIQPLMPPAFDRVVRTCLAKNPEDRLQTAHDLMLELKWILEGGSEAGLPKQVVKKKKQREAIAWGLAAILLISLIGLFLFFRERKQGTPFMQVSIVGPEHSQLLFSAISPDGSKIAMVLLEPSGNQSLWVRLIDSPQLRNLPETQGALFPFWSPDSESLGFFADQKLKKIEITAGHPETLADAPIPSGASWNRNGVIIFGGLQDGEKASIYAVSATGGPAKPVTKVNVPKEEAHRWPWFLPDGNHFLYLGDAYRTEEHHLKVGSLHSTESETLMSSFISDVAYSSHGYILFCRRGQLLAQRFDAKKLQLDGEAVPLVDEVAQNWQNHHHDFSLSENDVITYQSGTLKTDLSWFDRSGQLLGNVSEGERYAHVDLSPDNKSVAAETWDADGRVPDVWVLDLARNVKSRITFDPNSDGAPIWSADGNTLFFSSDRAVDGPYMDLYENGLNTGSGDQILLKSHSVNMVTSVSSDGKWLAVSAFGPGSSNDIFLLELSQRKLVPFLTSSFNEWFGQISPDRHWIAYVSDETSRPEIYIQSFPTPGRKFQISTNSGIQPRWRSDGKELFYLGGDNKLWSVEIRASGNLEAGMPKPLFSVRLRDTVSRYQYAVSSDGQRFLVNNMLISEVPAIQLVFNWRSLLAKR